MSLVGKSKGDRSGKQNKINRVCIKCLAKHDTESSLTLDKLSVFLLLQKLKECVFLLHFHYCQHLNINVLIQDAHQSAVQTSHHKHCHNNE